MSNPDPETIPSSVYRLQFNENFTFKKARALLPYLKELGIETVYCSPIFDAYSSHGYDVTNPNKLNSILGTEKEYEAFCAQLQKLSMGQMIDVVPNHMGFKGGKNHWWQDVLENGPHSTSASFFDVDWNSEKKELQNKVLLPILGRSYGKALEKQEIVLRYVDGEFVLLYGDYLLPVAPETYPIILQDEEDSYPSLVKFFHSFPLLTDKRKIKKEEGKKLLRELAGGSKKGLRWIQERVDNLNGKKRLRNSFDALDHLLDGQYYRLSNWKVASHEINYRRFFNINELVAICIEYPHVLEAHHHWLFELIENGSVQAMRIDHPDGLYDPDGYFKTLRNQHNLFTVVEKILDRKETLPDSWQVEGSVGYEYLNVLNGLFIRQDKERDFTEIYEEFVGEKVDFEEILYQSKKLFTTDHMASEVDSLGLMLDRLSEVNRDYRDFTRDDLTQALQEVIAFFPIYRTYIAPTGGVGKKDAQYISIAIEKAKSRTPSLDPSIYDFLRQLLLCKLKVKPEEAAGYREFILRFQQLTGPIMAKGMEDTSFYLYNRFLSLNEVGGAPTHFGYSASDFHRFNKEKHNHWPFGLLASSTHDTKRSEDVRMRMNVLSEIPEKWQLEVKKWRVVNAKHKIDGAPSANTEYFIYQMLVGIWPKRPLKNPEYKGFIERVWQIILKSLREGRKETGWVRPNIAYEEGVHHFLLAILSPQRQNPFLKLFVPFQKEIDNLGSWNSLSASALKIASCGVVDIYQGNEMFNYRGVDPDNRQPIEYDIYKKNLTLVKKQGITASPKLFVQWKALNFRKEHSALFLEGEYHPLRVRGHRKDNVIAFYRRINQKVVLVAAGRFFAALVHSQWEKPIGKIVWGDTQILVPKEWYGKELTDLFTEKGVKVKRQGQYIHISVAELFKSLPFAYAYAFEN